MFELNNRETLARHARWINQQAKNRGQLPPLFFFTDDLRTPDPVPLLQTLPRVTGVIFRNYADPNRLSLARELRTECQRRGMVLLVAGDPNLACEVQADGVHFPEWQIDELPRCRHKRRLRYVTAAVHNLPALLKAENSGASAVFAAPVFATQSHTSRNHLGVTRLAAFAACSQIPVYALGGISGRNSARLLSTGAAGIAAIGAFI